MKGKASCHEQSSSAGSQQLPGGHKHWGSPSRAAQLSPTQHTYQVVLLALRRVLGIPILFSASLLEVVVATTVAVVVA